MKLRPKIQPQLDRDFSPPALWHRAFRTRVTECLGGQDVLLALQRPDGTCFHHATQLLPPIRESQEQNIRYLERTLKFLLWQRGGSSIWICGCDDLVSQLAALYAPGGARAFDHDFFGRKVYGEPLTIRACRVKDLPSPCEETSALGGHIDGCRIGFDLGGSDRKCAAVMDGKVVFSEEIQWAPYFQTDPDYHWNGIRDSLARAAGQLPRVDAIGGSAAGIYVNNQVRVSSLFRGISPELFQTRIRDMFLEFQKEWDVPFEVVNDGEVTALAGTMSLRDGALLGISMGTSQAAGYCNAEGRITPWINELAFAPVDYRNDAPADEWSGDQGCGAQYFSQQCVARLAKAARLDFPDDMPFSEQLEEVQERVRSGNMAARSIFKTIGTYFGHSLAHYAEFYPLRHALILGRVTSGEGGQLIVEQARKALRAEYPDLAERINIAIPDEKMKRHGQAVAAASLPYLKHQ